MRFSAPGHGLALHFIIINWVVERQQGEVVHTARPYFLQISSFFERFSHLGFFKRFTFLDPGSWRRGNTAQRHRSWCRGAGTAPAWKPAWHPPGGGSAPQILAPSGTEVVPHRLHVDCHTKSDRKARRHDLWRRDVLSRCRKSWRRPYGSKNTICFLQDPKCENLL